MANKDQAGNEGMTRKQRRQAEREARKKGKTSATSSSGSSGPSMLVITIGAVVIGLVAVAALVVATGGFGEEDAEVALPDFDPPAEELRVGRSLGDPEAPVQIAAYEDPQCPACGLFTERIEPLLIAGPVSAGDVFFTYKDFTFIGPESFEAAVGMRVAEDMDGKFWEFHDIVFHNQDGEGQGAFSRDRLAEMAVLIGLDRDEFLERMDDAAYLEAVEAEIEEGRALGVTSTPSLIVNGQLLAGVPNWDELRSLIESEVAAADGEAEAA